MSRLLRISCYAPTIALLLGGVAGASLSPGSASGEGAGARAGTAAWFTAAGYRDLASGIHSFVARVSGTTSSFFQTSSGEYLPKQFMLPFPYTFILAGVDTTTPPDAGAVPWTMIPDDPFTPPADPAGGLTARVQVINAAPMTRPGEGPTSPRSSAMGRACRTPSPRPTAARAAISLRRRARTRSRSRRGVGRCTPAASRWPKGKCAHSSCRAPRMRRRRGRGTRRSPICSIISGRDPRSLIHARGSSPHGGEGDRG